jgi:selenocysteine lyase/cysteine desulfurase
LLETSGPAHGNVVVFADDYPDLVEIWSRHCRVAGVELRAIPGSTHARASARLVALREAYDERTQVIAVSHVHWVSGQTLPLAELAELRRPGGPLVVVDASQSLGVVPIDLDTTPVDLFVAAGYKWTGGTFGAAVAVASERTLELLGGGIGQSVLAPSSQSYLSAYVLGASVEWLRRVGHDDVVHHQRAVMDRLREELLRRDARLLVDEPGPSGIISATFEGRSAGELVDAARLRGVSVSERRGAVRFSPFLHTDVEELRPAIDVILGQRAARVSEPRSPTSATPPG